ncbi:hypothetical protein BC834DRAFT_905171 [Gloeopeniophorella convolvens]|nr:hypothetical protein BC834DRAFT_905171 [Gloeopeniophorella convolvens]
MMYVYWAAPLCTRPCECTVCCVLWSMGLSTSQCCTAAAAAVIAVVIAFASRLHSIYVAQVSGVIWSGGQRAHHVAVVRHVSCCASEVLTLWKHLGQLRGAGSAQGARDGDGMGAEWVYGAGRACEGAGRSGGSGSRVDRNGDCGCVIMQSNSKVGDAHSF